LKIASPLARRALAIYEKSYAPDHPGVAISLNNLGVALLDTDRLGEAEPLFRRALPILESNDDPSAKRVREHLQELSDKMAGSHDVAQPGGPERQTTATESSR
jgi:Tfp pilus assembly protein PilF